VRNVAYFNSSSVTNGEQNKTATVEPKEVAVTGSYPFSSGNSRTGWTRIAHESGTCPYGDWSIVAFAVCAEL